MQYDYPAVFYSDGKAVAFHFVDMENVHKEIPAATPLEKVDVKALQLVKMIHADTDR